MSWQRPTKVFEHGIIHLILLGLFLNAVDGFLWNGFSPEVISTKLGSSKGGTQLRVHLAGKGLDAVSPHYLRINDWNPVKATYQTVINGGIEDEFVMPPLQSSNKDVVRLSYSLDGVRYTRAGEFVYYDGEELATTALDPTDVEGVWHLQNSIFPRTNTSELLSMTFTPTCRDEAGVVSEARYPIPYEYARQSNAKLSIHCPIESPSPITHISINGQDYVAVEDPYIEHERHVDYIRLDQVANSTAAKTPPASNPPTANPPSAGPAFNQTPPKSAANPAPPSPVTNPPPPSPGGNPPPSISVPTPSKSPVAVSPPKSPPANIPPDGSLQNSGRHLGSNMPVCTSTDTGMGLSILVMFPTPTTMGPINVTTDVAGSFTGVGGPMTYVVSVIVGFPGQYKLTSIVPSCAGITPPLSFNVSGPPSPQFSYVSSTFATGGYAPGTSVSFNIQVVDGQGIVPSGFLGGGGGPFPFKVTLLQSAVVGGNNATFPVPFTTTQLGNGNWQVTCTPSRFLPTTGSVTLDGLPIVNSQFNFSLQTLTPTDATTKFRVSPNSTVPTGQQSLIIDSADTLPKYSLIHQITAQVTDPSGASIVTGICDMNRATVGCSFPMLLQKTGTYKLNVTIDSGTIISQASQISVIPGMALGSMSSLRLEGIVSNNTQKTAGDTILAHLNLLDAYGNPAATTFNYGEWNETVQVVLTCDQGSLITMTLVPGLGLTNASVQVTKAGYYVASAFIGSTGNALQGSGVYGFYVNPNMGNTSYWKGNLMVGEMIAGVYTPVVLALKDCYGNVIDGSSLRGVSPLTISMGNLNSSVQSVGRIFQLIPGLNQTVAKYGIIVTANYGSIQLASYNATCLPGKTLTNPIHYILSGCICKVSQRYYELSSFLTLK
ncbi:hypothetical protein M758_4G186300 [Ceratodon purpureus]|nr:hypothetical protein M758_4G186300 [Ceratodon purpureus]